ncbi:MAG: hypothetical protein L6R40_002086 [Gallowayella cf. fulva]|nr:MAG: hypothetical protein L6R40_002086 [Xanthomendoza cf. fulva]
MVLALIAILIGSLVTRKRTPAARTMFEWFIAAISLRIFSSAWNSIDRILNEECLEVRAVYIVFDVLFTYLAFLAESLLLGAILCYLVAQPLFSRQSPQQKRRKTLTFPHLFFCGLLTLVWLVITVLALAAVIQSVTGGGVVSSYGLIDGVRKLIGVFYFIYLMATGEEILGFAISTLISLRRETTEVHQSGRKVRTQPASHPIIATLLPSNNPTPAFPNPQLTNNQPPQLNILFLTLIGFPLIIRSIYQIVIAAKYDLMLRYYTVFEPPKARLAHALFVYLCTTIIYAGLVVIIRNMHEEDATVTDTENGAAGALSPEIQVMRAAEDGTPPRFHEHAVSSGEAGHQERWSRESRDHAHDPVFNRA